MSTGVDTSPTRAIGADQIESLRSGAVFYASGGGGSLIESDGLAADVVRRIAGGAVAVLATADLSSEMRCAVPSAASRPRAKPSLSSACAAFELLGERAGGSFDAVLPADLGVLSVLVACGVAAELDLPVIDAAGSWRATAHVDQSTWAAAGVIPSLIALTDGDETVVLQADTAEVADRSMRSLLGGSTFVGPVGMASWPMAGPTARRSSLEGALSAALAAGAAVELARSAGADPIEALVGAVDGAVLVGRGPLSGVTMTLRDHSEHFEIRIDTEDGPVEVLSSEGHVLLRRPTGDVAGAPDLLAIVATDGTPLTARDLAAPEREGEAVAVIATPAPCPGGVTTDPASFAGAHISLGGSGERIPFSAG